MTIIPEEYTKIDYGFSGVDEIPTTTTTETLPSTIDENDITRVILNALNPLEDKLDLLLQRKVATDDDNFALAVAEAETIYKTKITELEKIIMPLLVNLLKTADKEYIYWPNRAPIIQEAVDKVLAITRG
jgi:hypothetical protein